MFFYAVVSSRKFFSHEQFFAINHAKNTLSTRKKLHFGRNGSEFNPEKYVNAYQFYKKMNGRIDLKFLKSTN